MRPKRTTVAMTKDELIDRNLKCIEENLCFVTLKPLSSAPSITIWHSELLTDVRVIVSQ